MPSDKILLKGHQTRAWLAKSAEGRHRTQIQESARSFWLHYALHSAANRALGSQRLEPWAFGAQQSSIAGTVLPESYQCRPKRSSRQMRWLARLAHGFPGILWRIGGQHPPQFVSSIDEREVGFTSWGGTQRLYLESSRWKWLQESDQERIAVRARVRPHKLLRNLPQKADWRDRSTERWSNQTREANQTQ